MGSFNMHSFDGHTVDKYSITQLRGLFMRLPRYTPLYLFYASISGFRRGFHAGWPPAVYIDNERARSILLRGISMPLFSRRLSPVAQDRQRDARLVCDTARRQGIAEYELCRRAWLYWFGQAPDEAVIKARFLAFMLEGEIPFWLRHYCHRQSAVNFAPSSAGNPTIDVLFA